MQQPRASILIVTKDRRETLRRSVHSALLQTAPLEVIIIDDGSTDGTSGMIRAEFPTVRLESRSHSRGYIVRRNEGARLAMSQFIFSLDDDAVFSSPRIVEQTVAEFDHPRVSAVAIPCIDVRTNQMFRQGMGMPDETEFFVVDSFIGTAHAVRRDVFLKLGGYREHLLHQGEEGDYCLRMLAAGYVTRVGRADPIFHYESPDRSSERMDFYGRRNDILFTWQNVPMPYLPFHLVATVVRGSIYAVRSARHPQKMFAGMFSGLAECFRGDFERKPVNPRIYRLSRELKKRGPLPLRSVLDCLPALVED
jgi:glycosyltransferase involved in cell wall biosynthesis